jgi:hypothetical protein
MRTPLALAVLIAASASAHAQALFSNASPNPGSPALAPASSTLSGVAAPLGESWSELQAGVTGECNAVAGFSVHAADEQGLYRLADDFEVPAESLWQLDTLRVYAFVPNHSGSSPFSAVTVRVWLGQPGTPDAVVIAGDADTNVLANASSSGIYRVFNSLRSPLPPAPDTSRAIWSVDASLAGTVLGPGRYWIDWQLACTNPDNPAFSPSATLASFRAPLGANALQFRDAVGPALGQWTPLLMAFGTRSSRTSSSSGIHFGQRASGWNPKMQPYIYGKRNGIHIIDIKETIKGLLLAKKFITKRSPTARTCASSAPSARPRTSRDPRVPTSRCTS